MKLAYETLEIWQLAMKLAEITHSLREKFPREEKYGLWSQLINAVESTPLLIAEGYGRKPPPDRAHFMDQAIASNLEAKTAYQISVKKSYVTKRQFQQLISPLIEKIHFKTIAFKKYLFRAKRSPVSSERSDQPFQPSEAIPRFDQTRNGFTLFEMLMVIFIMGLIIIMGGNLFFSILKGASKAEITKEVKQNGDYALAVMERMIRNAQKIDDCSTGNSVKISNLDGGQTEFKCLVDSGVAKIASVSAGLTGNNVTLGASCPGTLSFTCNLTTVPPKVTISFTLSQKGSPDRPEEAASVPFQTTISLRTY